MTDKQREEWIEEKARTMIHLVLNHIEDYETEVDVEQGEKVAQDFIRTLLNEIKPKVSREWIYYFCAYINAGYKSPIDDKARVNHAIKKLKEIGVEVEE